MTRNRKMVIVATGAILVVMILFPPWRAELYQVSRELKTGRVYAPASHFSAGYGFLLSPPDPDLSEHYRQGSFVNLAVDLDRLALQCAAVLVTGIVLFLVLGGPE